MFTTKVNFRGKYNDLEFQYKKDTSLLHRQEKAKAFGEKYDNNRVIVVFETHQKSEFQKNATKLMGIEKTKLIIELVAQIRESLGINSKEAIFLYCKTTLIQLQGQIGELHAKYKDLDDNHLYLKVADFQTFG